MVIPRLRRSAHSSVWRRIGPIATAPWSSISMATSSSSAPTRMVLLLHGEDSFRTRLRLAELVRALLERGDVTSTDLSRQRDFRLGGSLGVTRHDARMDDAATVLLSGQSQGLFDAIDEPRVVVVENAEALRDLTLIARFPPEAALILVSVERLGGGRARRRQQRVAPDAAPSTLVEAVEAVGGSVEHVEQLPPAEVPRWIEARAALHEVRLDAAAVAELASAIGSD